MSGFEDYGPKADDGLGTPKMDAECFECDHPLSSHNAQPEGACRECDCAGWTQLKEPK